MANDFVPREPEIEFYVETEKDVTGSAGDLIRHEAIEPGEYAFVAGAGAMYRVLYQSTSGTKARLGQAIAVSGLIAFPDGRAPVGGWPVVSWAHGTVGSADECAPSMDAYVDAEPGDEGLGLLRKINRAPHRLLSGLMAAGWAVAMTDYEGLGTRGNHPFLLGESEGRGVLDIVEAARQLAVLTDRPPLSERYAIVGHSQGGQAALFAAHLATRSTDPYSAHGALAGVAALAPASNLKGTLNPFDDPGLLLAYRHPQPVGDLGGFYALFSNGVFGGDPDIEATEIFQPDALNKYRDDFDTKSRAELSLDDFWMERAPLDADEPENGIFRSPTLDPSSPRARAWNAYWRQVDGFDPAKQIRVPIRVSQALGDERVKADKTRRLIAELRRINGTDSVAELYYGVLAGRPDPASLGDHFALLVDESEIQAVVDWLDEL
ncbi:lipase family protein [Catenulispora rubra]|uniref:lipase family protein n=1 Tax=Catenulispora rubra TaxID=280293 RepID=UPI0018927CD4|nr:lipase family protein [Catenulispora rubra]